VNVVFRNLDYLRTKCVNSDFRAQNTPKCVCGRGFATVNNFLEW